MAGSTRRVKDRRAKDPAGRVSDADRRRVKDPAGRTADVDRGSDIEQAYRKTKEKRS